jgi:lysophospholipase L1-like esterase
VLQRARRLLRAVVLAGGVLAGGLLASGLAGGALAGGLTAAPAAHAQAPSDVLVVGDSLAVGLEPSLTAMLGGPPTTWDARSGRTTPDGLRALRAALRTVRPTTVVVSLGTNDGPDPARFADRIRRALAAIPQDACVVWSAIYRPPRKGPYLALNRVLRAAPATHPRLVVVNWDRAVAAAKVTLPDGLHPDAAGFRYRSAMIAHAVRTDCASPPPGGLLAPDGV